jgi:hypothetical protein
MLNLLPMNWCQCYLSFLFTVNYAPTKKAKYIAAFNNIWLSKYLQVLPKSGTQSQYSSLSWKLYLVWKCVPQTSTVTYFDGASIRKKKFM